MGAFDDYMVMVLFVLLLKSIYFNFFHFLSFHLGSKTNNIKMVNKERFPSATSQSLNLCLNLFLCDRRISYITLPSLPSPPYHN